MRQQGQPKQIEQNAMKTWTLSIVVVMNQWKKHMLVLQQNMSVAFPEPRMGSAS
jgi:hypothetical protein